MIFFQTSITINKSIVQKLAHFLLCWISLYIVKVYDGGLCLTDYQIVHQFDQGHA